VAKQQITQKVVEFVSKDIRSFEIVAEWGFIELAHTLIKARIKCGQASADDILPNPATVPRNLVVKFFDVKDNVVVPEIRSLLSESGVWVTICGQMSITELVISHIDCSLREWKMGFSCPYFVDFQFDGDLQHTSALHSLLATYRAY